MEIAFWICLFIVFYTYLGYGITLCAILCIKRMAGKIRTEPRLPEHDEDLPDVTLMVCAYNEQDVVDMKLENTRQMDYPKDKLHLLWVTDGSNDQTNERLSAYPDVEVLYQPQRQGKTAALNRGIAHAQTSIVIMTDANTCLNPGAVREIVRLFQDPTVGCVAGEKRVMQRTEDQMAAKGEGIYWKYESRLKRWDDELYSAMGAAGELCAIRKELYQPMPADTLLDDFIMSMRLLPMGYRIAYTAEAYAMEYGSADLAEESKRKRRIAAGGLQSIARLWPLLNVFRHPLVTFQYVSHRVLRWSITPFALVAVAVLNVLLVLTNAGSIYTLIWLLQLLFYGCATAGWWLERHGKKVTVCYVAYYFVFMNTQVFRGISYLMNHRNSGAWEKARRG